MVLVDDVVNDISAFSILASAPNVSVIAADRDYRLATATHLLPTGTTILRVSGQNHGDLQAAWETIPLQIRSDKLSYPPMESGAAASLLEFMQMNVTSPLLHKRIADAVVELAKSDPRTAYLLVLTCHVHACRTPVSMDMILGFLDEPFINYFDIRREVVRIGELLHEYTGDLATEPQDYFTARSVLLAESILQEVPRRLLGSVLEQLHSNVSPVRIPSYNIFRRSAFDHTLFGRAFPDTEAAVSLYDYLIMRDANEYIRQQKALFLADRGDYIGAFREIDHARARISRHKNWSIENSYYKILFYSNLPQHETEEAHEQLVRALDGLATCFAQDRRKGMHSLVSADCTLRFASKIRTSQALDFLGRSEVQLKSVIGTQPWLERPPHLLNSSSAASVRWSGGSGL